MRIPKYIIPLLVIGLLYGGYVMRFAFLKPTTEFSFNAEGSAKLECIVEGLKCKGTANFFTKLYEGRQGIASIVTFASEHQAVFTYNPEVISPEKIREIMEADIPLRDGTKRQVFRCVNME